MKKIYAAARYSGAGLVAAGAVTNAILVARDVAYYDLSAAVMDIGFTAVCIGGSAYLFKSTMKAALRDRKPVNSQPAQAPGQVRQDRPST